MAHVKIEDIDVTIKLANRNTITPLGMVRDVEVFCGKIKYPTDFLVLGSPQDDLCHIIFARPFLNTVNARIDCGKQTVGVSFGDESHEFNFSKSSKQPQKKDLPCKDEIIGLASIAVPPTDPLEQYLLDHENVLHMHERNEIDKIFFEQRPLLKHNLTIETLGGPPPPKGDPVFELNRYLILLNMLILMRKRYILLLLVLTFQNMKKKDY